MIDLWLVRHGQTDWNLTGRWQGQSPNAPGLNDFGYTQIRNMLNQFDGTLFSAIYSSDLLRAEQSADCIARHLGLTVHLEPRLREINLGDWEGLLSEVINSQYPEEILERKLDSLHARAPGGESLLEVYERVSAFLNEIKPKYPDGAVILVAHGVSLAIIVCTVLGIPLQQVYDHIPQNAQPYFLKWN